MEWENALNAFCNICKENAIDFYLIGSVTAAVRGVDIEPHDIDVIVDIHDLPAIRRGFDRHIREPIQKCPEDAVVGYFGKLELHGVTIEVSAVPQNRHGRHPIEILCWNGHIIKAQSLELLYKVYKRSARTDYYSAIESYWDHGEG